MTRSRRPFFLYLANIAPHWPLQAKPADISKYQGRYDRGWDEVRRERFARQQAMRLLPAGTKLSAQDEEARVWGERGAAKQCGTVHGHLRGAGRLH